MLCNDFSLVTFFSSGHAKAITGKITSKGSQEHTGHTHESTFTLNAIE
jgi:hypothetical protein